MTRWGAARQRRDAAAQQKGQQSIVNRLAQEEQIRISLASARAVDDLIADFLGAMQGAGYPGLLKQGRDRFWEVSLGAYGQRMRISPDGTWEYSDPPRPGDSMASTEQTLRRYPLFLRRDKRGKFDSNGGTVDLEKLVDALSAVLTQHDVPLPS